MVARCHGYPLHCLAGDKGFCRTRQMDKAWPALHRGKTPIMLTQGGMRAWPGNQHKAACCGLGRGVDQKFLKGFRKAICVLPGMTWQNPQLSGSGHAME